MLYSKLKAVEYGILEQFMISKVKKELKRFQKKIRTPKKEIKENKKKEYLLHNLSYEISDKIKNGILTLDIPIVENKNTTLDRILNEKCSLVRFGDGELGIMNGSRIHFQDRSAEMADRLKEIIKSNEDRLLIGLPDCFGSLDGFMPFVADFWRKWMAKKRQMVYSYLDMDRVYYDAFFTRVYVPYLKTQQHYNECTSYFERLKQIWKDRDVVVCEGEGTRFGLFNDLLKDAKSISRILCPARNAFNKYTEIYSAFNDISKDKLVLVALGPTATVLAYDLHHAGYQAIDIGHLDLEYEWFRRKDEMGRPIEFKYTDGSKEGRKVHKINSSEYEQQILKEIY